MFLTKKVISLLLCCLLAFSFCITGSAAEDEFQPIVGIILDSTELTVYYGGTGKLTATVVPSNASEKGITWKSSNEALLTVDANGNLTAAKDTAESPSGPQTVTVTATSTFDSKIFAKCTVTVDNEPESKIAAALKEIINLLKGALPTIIEFGKTTLKPLFETLVNFIKDLFSKISVPTPAA